MSHSRVSLFIATVASGLMGCTVSADISIDPIKPQASSPLPQADDPWFIDAQQKLIQAPAHRRFEKRAKNVILFIGDGMSVATVTAARIHEGQLRGENGEENTLSFEKLPYVALAKTYNTDAQTPDSAGTATALLTGVKTKIGVLGLDETVEEGKCGSGNEVRTLLEMAEEKGLATGVISTARITHATPASTFAHAASRDWEYTAKDGCPDIASQLVDFSVGDGIEVALGGGRAIFLPETKVDPEYSDQKGRRKDGQNLIQTWQEKNPDGTYVWNEQGFSNIDTTTTGPVLGLFQPSHMQFETNRGEDPSGEPSLSAMTKKAIEILSRDDDGFFLMVEAGRIDHGHHFGNAQHALTDTIEYAKAVEEALKLVDLKDTLIIVTADHSHTLTMAGYAPRGNPILGLAKPPAFGAPLDGKPYTTLGYANGPGALVDKPRADLSEVDTQAKTFQQPALVPLRSETHGGDDVPVYAGGPMANHLNGVVEQNYIFHVMEHALGF